MAKLIEKDGQKFIVIENEIELNDLDQAIKITQSSIDNIDYNTKGLKQRREALTIKLNELKAIKDSLVGKVKEAEPIDPAP